MPRLHVIFTLDCQPAATRWAPEGPTSWELSARAIDGFCTRLLTAGFPSTVFLTPRCAVEHGPLVQEMASCGIELGLYVQPQSLSHGRYKRYLGQYSREEQRAIITLATSEFQAALDRRPQSVRSAMFSASDDTFPLLYELGFRQGSSSSPGRNIAKHGALWREAVTDPHYVAPTSRLARGNLPFLEIPVTTDALQERGGISPDLAIENGTFEKWHHPLVEGQLRRMEEEGVAFRALCFITRNCFDYRDASQQRDTLDAIIAYLAELEDRYEVVPTTVSGAHARFREVMQQVTGHGADSSFSS